MSTGTPQMGGEGAVVRGGLDTESTLMSTGTPQMGGEGAVVRGGLDREHAHVHGHTTDGWRRGSEDCEQAPSGPHKAVLHSTFRKAREGES